jgi:hypothetical protein
MGLSLGVVGLVDPAAFGMARRLVVQVALAAIVLAFPMSLVRLTTRAAVLLLAAAVVTAVTALRGGTLTMTQIVDAVRQPETMARVALQDIQTPTQ